MIFASFSYTGPSWIVILTALAGGAALAIICFFIKGIWIGGITGLLYGFVVGGYVIGKGWGDMTVIMQMFYAPVLGFIGGIVGAVAAATGKVVMQSKLSQNGTTDQMRGDPT